MNKFRKILKDGDCEPISSVDEKLTKKDVKPEGKGKKRRRLMFKTMFVMSIVFIMISVSYSWFTSSDKAIIDGININVVDTKDLTSNPPKVYGQLSPVSGDGKNFFVPEMGEVAIETESEEAPEEGEETDDGAQTEKSDGYTVYTYDKMGDTYETTSDDVTADSLEEKVSNVRVIDFSLDMSGTAETLYLISGTAIVPSTGAPEYLTGALRASFLKKTAQGYETLFIWIPDISSSKSGTAGDELSYTFVTDGGTAKTVNISSGTGSTEVDDIKYVWGPVGEDGIEFDSLSGEGNYRCVIWLDGNDRECNSELIGQNFKISLNISPDAAVN